MLEELIGNDPQAIDDVLAEFVGSATTLMSSIETAVANEDAEAVKLAVHSLKSAARSIGALGLARRCELLEHGAPHERWDDLSMVRDSASAQFAAVRRYILDRAATVTPRESN